jgi:hypothetical protein
VKIQVVGNKNIIESVDVVIDSATNQLHLRLATRDRWVPHQISGGWGLFSKQCLPDATLPEHRLIAVGGGEAEADVPGAEVVFMPETAEERRMLFGLAYHLTEKEQIEYVILPSDRPSATALKPIAIWLSR